MANGSENTKANTPLKAPEKEGEKLLTAKVAPRKSIMISNTVTKYPGETVEFPEKEMNRLKADGFVVDIGTEVAKEEIEPGATVRQDSKDTVTIERVKDGRPSATSTIR